MPKKNLAWVLVVVMIALLLWQLPPFIAERDSVLRYFGPLAEIRTHILRSYSQPVDDGALVSDAVHAAANAMIAGLHDPYAKYLDPEEYARFQRRSEGLSGGPGIDVAVIGEQVLVQNVAPGTPAEGARLRRGDELLAIDGEPVGKMELPDIGEKLSGEPGSEVVLTIRTPGGESRDVTLTRATLQTNPVQGWRRHADGTWDYLIDPDYRIGYVRLTEFLPNAASRLDEAIDTLSRDRANAWVLDLRANHGGLFDAAVDVADRFLASGLIVATRGRAADKRECWARLDGTYPNLPLVVLVNGWSASSAEIVAGALRDQGRALVIGERTYGKGVVQDLIPIKGGSAIKLTTRHYYLPGGTCIQKTPQTEAAGTWGVKPNIVVPLTPKQREDWVHVWLRPDWEQAASASTVATTQPPAATQEAGTLLAADPQLRRALRELRRQLETNGSSDSRD